MRTLVLVATLVSVALAGCTTAPSSLEEASVDPGAVAGQNFETAIDHQGSTSLNACVMTPVQGACQGESSATTLFPLDAGVTHVAAEVAWTPASPATRELGVDVIERLPDGGWQYVEGFSARGASPIAVDWDLSSVADKDLEFYVHTLIESPSAPAGAVARVPQEFTVTGVMHGTTPAPAENAEAADA